MSDLFFKFPSTPHLAALGGNRIRNDKVLSRVNRNAFLKNRLIVEEKIDGANLGISFNGQGNLILQNRGSILSQPYSGQWTKLDWWLPPRLEILFDHLHDRYILFGEWCFAKHSLGYDRLPDYYLGFDLFDKTSKQFFPFDLRNQMFERMNISSVPFIKRGAFSLLQLERLMGNSRFSDDPAEGIYLRHDGDNWLKQRAKLVKAKFIQTIDVHWSRKTITQNQIMGNSYL
jgi:ATP-dependent RNA circularization protein (DNA/RNA ligase family)